jgi:hypothetical protein
VLLVITLAIYMIQLRFFGFGQARS